MTSAVPLEASGAGVDCLLFLLPRCLTCDVGVDIVMLLPCPWAGLGWSQCFEKEEAGFGADDDTHSKVLRAEAGYSAGDEA